MKAQDISKSTGKRGTDGGWERGGGGRGVGSEGAWERGEARGTGSGGIYLAHRPNPGEPGEAWDVEPSPWRSPRPWPAVTVPVQIWALPRGPCSTGELLCLLVNHLRPSQDVRAQALWKVVLFATQALPCGPRCHPFVQYSRADRSSSHPLQAAISQQSARQRQILLWLLLLTLANSWILSISLRSLEGDGCRHSHGGHGQGPIWELKMRYCMDQLAYAKGRKAQALRRRHHPLPHPPSRAGFTWYKGGFCHQGPQPV